MSSTLSEGVRVPDIGSVNWGADVNFNWGLLNTALANISGNVKVNVANTWTATQTFTETISGSIDGIAARAVGDEDGNNIKSALASKAADADVVHLAGAETISGDKTFTGAVATHNITPETDNTYSLGSSSYQWASVYARTYYYNGTAWGLDKYNQWTEVNDFSNLIGLNGAELWFKNINVDDFTTNPAEVCAKSILQLWNKNTTQYSGGLIDYQMTDGSHVLEMVCFGYPLNSTTPHQHRFRLAAYRDGGADFYPVYNGAVNLGTSTNKWKTLNGINPGALSFPGASTVDLSGNITDINGGINEYTPAVNGWVQIVVPNAADAYLSVRSYYSPYSGDSVMGNSSTLARLCITVPVRSGIKHVIYVKAASITSAVFRPCLGNV